FLTVRSQLIQTEFQQQYFFLSRLKFFCLGECHQSSILLFQISIRTGSINLYDLFSAVSVSCIYSLCLHNKSAIFVKYRREYFCLKLRVGKPVPETITHRHIKRDRKSTRLNSSHV